MKAVSLLLILLVPLSSAFAASSYELVVDDHHFDIEYDVDADVLAMAIDQELNSLLIGLDNTQNSEFILTLDKQIISAPNNDFFILVNGEDTDYSYTDNDAEFSLRFFIPEFTEEIEIVGTHVIPEFPFGVILLLAGIVSVIALLDKTKSFQKLF